MSGFLKNDQPSKRRRAGERGLDQAPDGGFRSSLRPVAPSEARPGFKSTRRTGADGDDDDGLTLAGERRPVAPTPRDRDRPAAGMLEDRDDADLGSRADWLKTPPTDGAVETDDDDSFFEAYDDIDGVEDSGASATGPASDIGEDGRAATIDPEVEAVLAPPARHQDAAMESPGADDSFLEIYDDAVESVEESEMSTVERGADINDDGRASIIDPDALAPPVGDQGAPADRRAAADGFFEVYDQSDDRVDVDDPGDDLQVPTSSRDGQPVLAGRDPPCWPDDEVRTSPAGLKRPEKPRPAAARANAAGLRRPDPEIVRGAPGKTTAEPYPAAAAVAWSATEQPTPDLPPSVLSALLIAEIPRLRRFAVAWLGDPALADRLVHSSVKRAMAEPAAALQFGAVGLSLLAMIYRLRHEMPAEVGMAGSSTNIAGFEAQVLDQVRGADRQELKDFARAMAGLGEDDRAVLLLAALDNLTYQEVAKVIGIPVGRIMARFNRARETLRHALTGPDGDAEADA